jgi:peroxiredoxin
MFTLLLCAGPVAVLGQQNQPVWSEPEKAILEQIRGLRKVPDEARGGVTRELALKIRALPPSANQVRLANGLANLSTEGDFGRDTLQEVATTLANALQAHPVEGKPGEPAAPYMSLAQLFRYEHVEAAVDNPQFAAAMARLQADDQQRQNPDFTLTDLAGKKWSMSELRGKVVLVNFWATWCPPCRKEIPDMEALYDKFKNQGLVVLGISDDDEAKIREYAAAQKINYPLLLDPGRKVTELFRVEGIPKSFVYDRSGKLVSQAIDMRTRQQFLQMLAEAGLK